MKLYEQVDLARKYGDGSHIGITESVTEKEPDKTAMALNVARRLSESKPVEAVPVQMTAMPVPS